MAEMKHSDNSGQTTDNKFDHIDFLACLLGPLEQKTLIYHPIDAVSQMKGDSGIGCIDVNGGSSHPGGYSSRVNSQDSSFPIKYS